MQIQCVLTSSVAGFLLVALLFAQGCTSNPEDCECTGGTAECISNDWPVPPGGDVNDPGGLMRCVIVDGRNCEGCMEEITYYTGTFEPCTVPGEAEGCFFTACKEAGCSPVCEETVYKAQQACKGRINNDDGTCDDTFNNRPCLYAAV